jgi:hypothetical protein
MKYDLERARLAVEFLVGSRYFPQHVRGLRSAVQRPRALPYKGDEEVLNELLIIGRQSEQAMENLIAVAKFKRDDDRGEYQRRFMKEQRERWRKLFKLEERATGRKLTLDQRDQLAKEAQSQWVEERDAYIAARTAQYKIQYDVDVTFENRLGFIAQFWENKGKELDAMLAEPPSQEHRIKKKKRTVVIQTPEDDTAMKLALKKLIDRQK